MHRNNIKPKTPRNVAELTTDDDIVKITAENKVTKTEKPKRKTGKTMKQIAKASLIDEVAEPKQMNIRTRTATKVKPTETTNKPIEQQHQASYSNTPKQLNNNTTPKRRGRPKQNSSKPTAINTNVHQDQKGDHLSEQAKLREKPTRRRRRDCISEIARV
jgi:hypothetical protein